MTGPPELYREYNRDEVVAGLTNGPGRVLVEGGDWHLFPGMAIVFCELVDSPESSGFVRGGLFRWVGVRPGWIDVLPVEVVGNKNPQVEIHLFVRKVGEPRHLYVGRLEPSFRGGGFAVSAEFRMLTPLPSELWAKLGGPDSGDLHLADVDAALDRLRGPIDVGGRLDVLHRLVEYWHGKLTPADGLSEGELADKAMPAPLRWWYRMAGRRPEILCAQNLLYRPGELRMLDGLLEIYVENQYCYQWATLAEGEDPPVFGRESPEEPWKPEGLTLSQHLTLACLFEAPLIAPYQAWTPHLPEDALRRIAAHAPRIETGSWNWCGSMRCFAGGGAFVHVMGKATDDPDAAYSAWVGAKTEHPLQFLKSDAEVWNDVDF